MACGRFYFLSPPVRRQPGRDHPPQFTIRPRNYITYRLSVRISSSIGSDSVDNYFTFTVHIYISSPPNYIPLSPHPLLLLDYDGTNHPGFSAGIHPDQRALFFHPYLSPRVLVWYYLRAKSHNYTETTRYVFAVFVLTATRIKTQNRMCMSFI